MNYLIIMIAYSEIIDVKYFKYIISYLLVTNKAELEIHYVVAPYVCNSSIH
jgi:hypothetical protein